MAGVVEIETLTDDGWDDNSDEVVDVLFWEKDLFCVDGVNTFVVGVEILFWFDVGFASPFSTSGTSVASLASAGVKPTAFCNLADALFSKSFAILFGSIPACFNKFWADSGNNEFGSLANVFALFNISVPFFPNNVPTTPVNAVIATPSGFLPSPSTGASGLSGASGLVPSLVVVLLVPFNPGIDKPNRLAINDNINNNTEPNAVPAKIVAKLLLDESFTIIVLSPVAFCVGETLAFDIKNNGELDIPNTLIDALIDIVTADVLDDVTDDELDDEIDDDTDDELDDEIDDETDDELDNELDDETDRLVDDEIVDVNDRLVDDEIVDEIDGLVDDEIVDVNDRLVDDEISDVDDGLVDDEISDVDDGLVDDETDGLIDDEIVDVNDRLVDDEIVDEIDGLVDLVIDNDVELDGDDDTVVDELVVWVTDTDDDAIVVPDGETVGDADIDWTGPVYICKNAVFVDVNQKTLRGGLVVDVVYRDPAIGVSPPPKT